MLATETSDIRLQTLQERQEQLIQEYLKQDTSAAPSFLKKQSLLLDDYFHESYEHSAVGPAININKNPYAIVALGGYGRQEQCIHSDVDLLFLFENSIPDEAAALVREFIHPLWNIGMDVGYTVQTPDGCIQLAQKDVEMLTSLLDSRFICGISPLYSKLRDQFRKTFMKDQAGDVIDRVIQRNRERHDRFGDSSYLLQPNLKEGDGGLRDYHTIMWIARIKADVQQPRDLEYYGCMSADEFQRLIRSLAFIWHVRNHLHDLAERKYDQLLFRYQEEIARRMKYRKRNSQLPVERFLGELHGHMNFLKQHEQMQVYEMENEKRPRRGRKPRSASLVEGLQVRRGMLGFVSSRIIPENPFLLMQIFEESARLQLPLSPEARRLVREFLHLVTKQFRTAARAVHSFEQILLSSPSRFNVLEAMNETGFLVRFIPQFNAVLNRIQYDEYHLFPVDKHLLRTVDMIKLFGTTEDPTGKPLCAEIYQRLESPVLLLWATLLHDVGKGKSEGDHSTTGAEVVREIMTVKGYSPEEVDTVSFLVAEHLFLVKIATRRDIQDEETALLCARRIKKIDRLDMLYLLAVADSASTGPKAWNAWTASLMEGLYLNVLSVLRTGELTSTEAVTVMDRKKTLLMEAADTNREQEEIEALFHYMSPRYLLYTPTHDLKDHIALYRRLGDARFIWEISQNIVSDTRTLTLCARDFPGLFSKIAGVFTLNSIRILDAQVYTWRNNIALDVFEVEPPPDRLYEQVKWQQAAEALEATLSGEMDIDTTLRERLSEYGYTRPKPVSGQRHLNRVEIDNESSSFFTIIEVFAYDHPGLLYGITDALFKSRLDVWIAKIATKVDQVVDVFYVRDFDGQKIESPDQLAMIQTEVQKVLGEIL